MNYIILRSIFGKGLEIIPDIGFKVVGEHQLDDHICNVADSILANGGYETMSQYEKDYDMYDNPMGETLTICKVLNEFKGKCTDIYIEDVLKNKEKQKSEEEYELYLKLKEKFEGTEK